MLIGYLKNVDFKGEVRLIRIFDLNRLEILNRKKKIDAMISIASSTFAFSIQCLLSPSIRKIQIFGLGGSLIYWVYKKMEQNNFLGEYERK